MSSNNNSIKDTISNYSKQLFGFIKKRVDRTEDAEDILQEIWYQLSSLTDLSSIENMGSWLYALARNRIIDSFKKKKTALYDDFAVEDEEGEWSIQDLIAANNELPDDHLFKKMFWETFFSALEELPIKQREAFEKNELNQMSLQQIADESGENIKTIISRKRYAVLHLQQRLQELYIDLNNSK